MAHLNIQHGTSEPGGQGSPYVQFVAGQQAIDASGLIYTTDPALAYGQIRFLDGAPKDTVVQMLREIADFFEREPSST